MVASWGRFEEGQTFVDKTFVGCAKLYERNEQQRELIEAFQRRRSSSLTTNELVLITGPSGTGKTTLAKAFRSHVEHQENGIWMQGKFDQIHREEPYAAFLSAIEELVKEVEARGAEDILKIQEAIANSVDPFDQQWLARAVPLLMRILWASSENLLTATSSGGAVLNSGAVARNQFRRLIPNLLATICSSLNASIVIFLDDLQWSDLASLELLRDLACDCETPSLMVFGACRGDDVSIDHPLSATLRQLEDKDNVKITNVSVSNLHVAAVQEFVSDALELPALVVQPLADIVFRESEGNVFYMIRFMQNLQECGFLYRDVINHQWTWNEEQIQPRFNDVLQLLSSAIRNLPDNVQQLLQVAACLGSKFKESHLQKIVSYEVEPALATAEEKNMVSVDNDSGECNWVHDRWQQAAYQLIPKAEQPQFHLQIGRMLWNGLTSEKEIDDNIFLTVNQIVKGAHLITDDEERESAATLCLRAGEKAGRSSAFQAAATFFEHGIGLLNRRHWRDQYELSLSLFNGAAEMEYCNGRFDRVNILAEEVIKNARNVMDRLPAYTTMVYAVGTHGKLTAAITLGLSVLKQLDLSFPRNAKMWHVALEFRKTQQALRGKSDDEILSLPSMTNASTFAALKLMNLLYLFAKVERWNLCAVMALRMVRMTLENGLAGASSAPGFAFYGIILCWLGDVDEGYRFAKLSVAILNKFYVKEWIPRVLGTVFGIVYPWKLPLRECMSGMRDGYRVGFETGDHEFASRCASLYSLAHFLSGQPLLGLVPLMKTFFIHLQRFLQNKQASFTGIAIQLLQSITGEEASLSSSDLLTTVKNAEEREPNVFSKLASMTMITSCLLGNFVLADQIATRYGPPPRMGPPFIVIAHFTYHALACLALSHRYGGKLRVARACLKALQKIAGRCPENVANKIVLIEAEIASLLGNLETAQLKYDESILLAEREGNLMEQALACERAGLFSRRIGSLSGALLYFERAEILYQEWGSPVKMQQVKNIAEPDKLQLKTTS